jgi:hypothetical protein
MGLAAQIAACCMENTYTWRETNKRGDHDGKAILGRSFYNTN